MSSQIFPSQSRRHFQLLWIYGPDWQLTQWEEPSISLKVAWITSVHGWAWKLQLIAVYIYSNNLRNMRRTTTDWISFALQEEIGDGRQTLLINEKVFQCSGRLQRCKDALLDPIFLSFMQFSGKNAQIIGWRSVCEIPDPLLQWKNVEMTQNHVCREK